MKTLFIIPARGGSKGLPRKNILHLNGKPLIYYAIEYARLFVSDDSICVSTDDPEIASEIALIGYNIPFLRPDFLSDDNAAMYDVLIHALNHFEAKGFSFELIVLLQPTSPFRRAEFYFNSLKLMKPGVDMVVSVNEAKANPYFNLFEEDNFGNLKISKYSDRIVRRQDAPKVYQYNGVMYLINTSSLRSAGSLSAFDCIKKYEIPSEYSVDIDNALDFHVAEYLISNKLVQVDGKC